MIWGLTDLSSCILTVRELEGAAVDKGEVSEEKLVQGRRSALEVVWIPGMHKHATHSARWPSYN